MINSFILAGTIKNNPIVDLNQKFIEVVLETQKRDEEKRTKKLDARVLIPTSLPIRENGLVKGSIISFQGYLDNDWVIAEKITWIGWGVGPVINHEEKNHEQLSLF